MNATDNSTQMPNVKFVLAVLWIMHFLLWTFGDMLSLLQNISDPIDNGLLLYIAVPLALIQALMILLSVVCRRTIIRWVNITLAIVYFVFNVGFIAEAHFGWEYLLGAAYVSVNGLIAWFAWTWPAQEA